MRFDGNRIVDVSGESPEAGILREMLIGGTLIELGCGFNPKWPRHQIYPAGSNSPGALHFGIDLVKPSDYIRKTMPNSEEPPVHMDLVTFDSTMTAGEATLVRDGFLEALRDPDVVQMAARYADPVRSARKLAGLGKRLMRRMDDAAPRHAAVRPRPPNTLAVADRLRMAWFLVRGDIERLFAADDVVVDACVDAVEAAFAEQGRGAVGCCPDNNSPPQTAPNRNRDCVRSSCRHRTCEKAVSWARRSTARISLRVTSICG